MQLRQLINRTYAVVGIQHTRPARERAGYEYEGHLRGLTQPAEAGFVAVAEGFSPAGIGHRVTPVIKSQVVLLILFVLTACSQAPAAVDLTPVASAPTAASTLPSPTAVPTASVASAQDHLLTALKLMPDTTLRVSFTDWARIKAETGFPQLTGLGSDAERRDFFAAVARTQTLIHTAGLGQFPKDTSAWQPLYEQWGWTSADLIWEASAEPPAFVLRFRDDFDLRPLVARLEQRGFTRQDYQGSALYSYPLDIANPPPWLLDVDFTNIAVLADEHMLVMGLVPENVQQLLDAHSGQRSTLGERPAIQELARQLGPVSSAALADGATMCAKLDQMFGISRMSAADSPALAEQLQMVERTHPYTAIGAGYRYDGQQLRAQIVLSYDGVATAQSDLPLRRQLAEQGYSLLQLKPFDDFAFTVEDAQLDGNSMVLHVRPVTDNPQEIILSVRMPDAIFAGCPAASVH